MVVRHVSEFVATRNKSLWIKSHAQMNSRRSKHKVGMGIQQARMQSGWGGDLLFSNSGLCFALLEQLCLIKHLQ
jgi:hypothetical protein